jgi:hypothetical protein
MLRGVAIEDAKAARDRESARLGALIELHMSDEAWLMAKLGIIGKDEHYRFRKQCFVDRDKLDAHLTANTEHQGSQSGPLHGTVGQAERRSEK